MGHLKCPPVSGRRSKLAGSVSTPVKTCCPVRGHLIITLGMGMLLHHSLVGKGTLQWSGYVSKVCGRSSRPVRGSRNDTMPSTQLRQGWKPNGGTLRLRSREPHGVHCSEPSTDRFTSFRQDAGAPTQDRHRILVWFR